MMTKTFTVHTSLYSQKYLSMQDLLSQGEQCEEWPVQKVGTRENESVGLSCTQAHLLKLNLFPYLHVLSCECCFLPLLDPVHRSSSLILFHILIQCTLEKQTVTKVQPETACRKTPRWEISIRKSLIFTFFQENLCSIQL